MAPNPNLLIRRFCCSLLAVWSLTCFSYGYDQVEIDQTIPLADTKSSPTLLRQDPAGVLWFFDSRRKTINALGKDGRPTRVFAGGKSDSALFRTLVDFQFIRDGSMMISDSGSKRIAVISPEFKLKKSIPLKNPRALDVSSDDIIAAGEAKKNVVHLYSIDGVLLYDLAPPKEHAFKDISAVRFAADATLWILDAKRGRIHRFDNKRNWLGDIDDVPKPVDFDVDEYGFAYVSSSKGKWYEISPKGQVIGSFGAKGKRPGELNQPIGLVMQRDTLYVAEKKNRRIQSFRITNSQKRDMLRPEPVSRIQIRHLLSRDSQADLIRFMPDGRLLALDARHRRFSLIDDDKESTTDFGVKGNGTDGLNKPSYFSVDRKGRIWVADAGDDVIKEVSSDGKILRQLGEKGRKEGSINNPNILDVRPDGSFVVVDRGRSRIQVLNPDGLFLFSIGGEGRGPGQFREVTGLALSKDRVAVIDNKGPSLLFYDSSGKFVSQISNVEDQEPVWTELTSIASDSLGRFYVSDQKAGRIRLFDSMGTFIGDVSLSASRLDLSLDGRMVAQHRKSFDVYRVDVVPGPLKGFSAVDEEGVVKIQWNPCESCEGYRIYRATSPGEFYLLQSTKKTVFFDDTVRPGKPTSYGGRGLNRMGYQGLWTETGPIRPSRRKDLSLVSIESVKFDPVFTAAFKSYTDKPVGTVQVQNNDDRPIRNITLSLSLKKYTDYPTEIKINRLDSGEKRGVPVTITFSQSVLELTENTPVQVDVKVSYFENNERKSDSRNAPLMFYSRNAIVWNDKSRISSFITPRDEPVVDFSRAAIKAFLPELKGSTVGKQLAKAALFYESLNALEIAYVPDPNTPFAEADGNAEIIDYVQYPRETLRRKSGDCDDTTSLLSALLESIGVETALVDTPGHIFLMANTDESDPDVIGLPEERFVEFRGTLWVPIETTKVGHDFEEAWNAGVNEVQAGRKNNKIEFIPLVEASEKYAPVTLVEKEKNPVVFPKGKVKAGFLKTMEALQSERYNAQLAAIQQKIKMNPDDKMLLIRLGMVHVEGGKIYEGKRLFTELLQAPEPEVQSAANNNLGNLAYLTGDFKTASKHYADAYILSPDDGGILVNRARTAWKLGRRKEAQQYLYKAKELLPDWNQYADGIPAELLPKF